MVLRANVAIRSLGKQMWDLLTDPNRIGQYMPGVAKIRIIEPNIKYFSVSRYREGSNRKPRSRGNMHTFSGLGNAEIPEESWLTIVSEWVHGEWKREYFPAAREAVLHPIYH